MPITFSRWKDSRPSLFSYSNRADTNAYVEFDWVHYSKVAAAEK